MNVIYTWEKFNQPKLQELEEAFKLVEVISKGKDELEKQLLLKDWVHNRLILRIPEKDYASGSAFEILEDAKKGKEFNCTQYALVLLQCATALGWYVRKLGVDADHNQDEEDMHHGVCDIWSSQMQKWYVIDPMHNLHYENNGIPLNSLEIRNQYINNKAINVKGVIGNKKSQVDFSVESKGFNTPSNYFWFFISLRNNFFEKPNIYDTKSLL